MLKGGAAAAVPPFVFYGLSGMLFGAAGAAGSRLNPDTGRPSLVQQIDSMRKQLADLQFQKRVDDLAAVYEKNVGSGLPRSDGLDAPDLTGYSGYKEADLYGRGEEITDLRALRGTDVRGEAGNKKLESGISGSGETEDGSTRAQEKGKREQGAADWARGHIVEQTINPASAAVES